MSNFDGVATGLTLNPGVKEQGIPTMSSDGFHRAEYVFSDSVMSARVLSGQDNVPRLLTSAPGNVSGALDLQQHLRPHSTIVLEIVGAVMFTVATVMNAYVVFPESQELTSLQPGDILMSIRIAIGNVIMFPANWATYLILVVILRESCVKQAPLASVAVVDGVSAGCVAVDRGASTSMTTYIKIDQEALFLTARAMIIYLFTLFLMLVTVGVSGHAFVTILFYGFAVFRALPAATRRWNREGSSHLSLSLVRRWVIAGLPLVLLPRTVFPSILRIWSPNDVTFVYPLVVSFMEYLAVSVLLPSKVVELYSDEALCIMARMGSATCESSRVGMLVVVANAPVGSFGGLINATIMGLVIEALSRNNLIAITFRAFKYHVTRYCCFPCHGKESIPPPLARFNRMGRFKRVYLGVKVDTEYWGVYMLIVIKCLGWGFGGSTAPAMDSDTGKLLDVLNCPWRVIAVVAVGELAGDLLTSLIGLCVLWWAPTELRVVAPVVTPAHAGLVVAMWMNVGALFLNGISSMGVLSDSLQVNSS